MPLDDPQLLLKLDYIEGVKNPAKFYVRKDLNINAEFMAFLRLLCYTDDVANLSSVYNKWGSYLKQSSGKNYQLFMEKFIVPPINHENEIKMFTLIKEMADNALKKYSTSLDHDKLHPNTSF